ncbi:MAG: hypothetical protein WCH43_00155 [Verrucomicrobiota bacterium]
MKTNSEKEPTDLVQALVSRLEKLEAKVAELGGFIDQLTRKASAPVSAPAPQAPKAPGELTPQLLAVIAAAIDTVIKVPHLIHSIHEIESGTSTFDAHDWSVEGRRQIFSSHRIR